MKHIPRFYVTTPHHGSAGDSVLLSPTQTHHCCVVLRLKPNDFVHVFNPSLGEWRATLQDITKQAQERWGMVRLETCLQPPSFHDSKHQRRLGLAFGVIKKEALLWMLEKTCELGVTDFYPLMTTFSQPLHMQHEKLRELLIQATQQCGRLDPPQIHHLHTLEDVFTYPYTFYAVLEREQDDVHAIIKSSQRIKNDTLLFVGPEGGFHEDEKKILKKMCMPLSLGRTILRAETAAIVGIDRLRQSV